MLLKNAQIGQNKFWRYLITIIIFSICFFAFQAAFMIPFFMKSEELGIDAQTFATMMATFDFSVLQMSKTYILILFMFPFTLSFAVLILLLKYVHKKPLLKVITGRDKFDWKRAFTGFFITLAFGGITTYLFVPPEILIYQFDISLFIPLLIVALILIPIQASLEEVFMRGYLFQALGLLFKSKIIPMIIIIVGFTSLHFANPEFNSDFTKILIAYALISTVLGLITVLDDGLELPMGIHSANNIFIAIFVSTKGGTIETDAIFQASLDDMMVYNDPLRSLISSAVLVAIFWYIYKWKISNLST